MKDAAIILMIAYFIGACNDTTKTGSSDQDSLKIEISDRLNIEVAEDTIISEEEETERIDYSVPKSLHDFENYFKSVNEFPVHLDSSFIEGIDAENFPVLHYGEIELLSKNHKGNMPYSYSLDWLFKAAYTIDSSKVHSVYEDYMNNTPYYETLYAEAYALLMFTVNNNKCFVWAVSHSTGDGCPHSSGIELILSIVENNSVKANYHIAGYSSGGDPPAWGSTGIYSSITKEGDFTIIHNNENGEDDENGEEIVEKSSSKYYYKLEYGELK